MHTSSVCNISIQIVTYMYMYILKYLTCCIKTIIAIQKKTQKQLKHTNYKEQIKIYSVLIKLQPTTISAIQHG